MLWCQWVEVVETLTYKTAAGFRGKKEATNPEVSTVVVY